MDVDGGVPEPLLPPQLALQNPELVGGYSFYVLPELERIVVMIDRDGDENYEPYLVPLAGGFPEPLAAESFAAAARTCSTSIPRRHAYFTSESREESMNFAYRVDLESGEVETIGAERRTARSSRPGRPTTRASFLADGYTVGRHRSSTSSTRDGAAPRALRDAARRARGGRRLPAHRARARRTPPRAARASCSSRRSSTTRAAPASSRFDRPGRDRARLRSTGSRTTASASSRASGTSRAIATR